MMHDIEIIRRAWQERLVGWPAGSQTLRLAVRVAPLLRPQAVFAPAGDHLVFRIEHGAFHGFKARRIVCEGVTVSATVDGAPIDVSNWSRDPDDCEDKA